MEVSSAPRVEAQHNGVTYSPAPYDVDHFRSFMIEYRKLFILDTEHTAVPRLLNRLRSVVFPADLGWLDEHGKRLKAARADLQDRTLVQDVVGNGDAAEVAVVPW